MSSFLKSVIRLLITAIVVFLLANFLPGSSVDSYTSAIFVALILGILNLFVKPILILLTLPVTILTFGLFLLVINAFLIMICAYFINGFGIDSFWYALLFSLFLSIIQSILFSVLD